MIVKPTLIQDHNLEVVNHSAKGFLYKLYIMIPKN